VGAAHVYSAAAKYDKLSTTAIAVSTAAGQVLPPVYISKGQYATHNVLQHCTRYPQSAIMYKPESHMVDGEVFIKLMEHLTTIIPGGVGKDNRVLLILDGHSSRTSWGVKQRAFQLGFDLLLMPPNATHLLQPLDQVFNSVKARFGEVLQMAASDSVGRGEAEFNPPLSQLLGLVDYSIATTIGITPPKGPTPLQHAFNKCGLWPPTKEGLLAAAAVSLSTDSRPPPSKRAVRPWAAQAMAVGAAGAVVAASAEQQMMKWMRATDGFNSRQEMGVWAAANSKEKKQRAARRPARST
jgi:hypothetical protein